MRVNRVSLVFHCALNMAGMTAHAAPKAMLIAAMMSSKTGSFTLSPKYFMHTTHARPPISTCPSAPMFQKRILNAGARARAMISIIAVFWKNLRMRRGVPNTPLNRSTKNSPNPFASVSPAVIIAPRTSAAITAPPRMSHACHLGISVRLDI